jgi:hypothetical protein
MRLSKSRARAGVPYLDDDASRWALFETQSGVYELE